MRGSCIKHEVVIKIIEKSIGYVIEIERRISVMKMPKTMGEDYKAIFKYLEENGIEPSTDTMPYTRYLDIDWDFTNEERGFG